MLDIWSLCHLELTRLQSATRSCDTNHNPAFILLYQPHPLSPSPFFFLKHALLSVTLSSISATHPGLLPFFLSFSLSSCSPLVSPPNCSLIRFGKPLASPFYPFPPSTPPFTAKHPLQRGQKKKNITELSHVQYRQNKINTLGSCMGENAQYSTCWGLTPRPSTADWKSTKKAAIQVLDFSFVLQV